MAFSNKNFIHKENKSFTFLSLVKSCLLFSLVFVGLCITISLFMSLIFYHTLDPSKMVNHISLTSLFVSALISAFCLSKKNGQKYILGGLMLGGMIFVILFVGALFTERKIFSPEFALRLAVPAVCVIGALLGMKRERKIKRKHR